MKKNSIYSYEFHEDGFYSHFIVEWEEEIEWEDITDEFEL